MVVVLDLTLFSAHCPCINELLLDAGNSSSVRDRRDGPEPDVPGGVV